MMKSVLEIETSELWRPKAHLQKVGQCRAAPHQGQSGRESCAVTPPAIYFKLTTYNNIR